MMFMGLFWLIPIGLLVAYLAGWRPDWGGGTWRELPRGESERRPLDVLKERYARGEMSREEYEDMRRDLES